MSNCFNNFEVCAVERPVHYCVPLCVCVLYPGMLLLIIQCIFSFVMLFDEIFNTIDLSGTPTNDRASTMSYRFL